MTIKNKISYFKNSKKLKKIKLLVCDVDGVLTDGSIVIDDNGIENKVFSTKDGMGIYVALKFGLNVAVITGSKSSAIVKRFQKFSKFQDLYIGKEYKMESLIEVMAKYNLNKDEVIYVGDDLIDLAPMEYVGLSFCPSDAHDAVKKTADIILSEAAGSGAVRVIIDMILKSQNIYDEAIKHYTEYYKK